IRELQDLGFIEVKPGAAGNAEFRRPNLFRLTYRLIMENGTEPTHEWRRIKTCEQAVAMARAARSKTRLRWGKPPPNPVGKPPTETSTFPVGETPTTVGGETPPPSISREGARLFSTPIHGKPRSSKGET